MARYRKIDPRIWNDEKFRTLSDSGKLAFLFLLTHPHMTAIGAMRGTVAGLAAELGWSFDAMRDAIGHAMSVGMVDANLEASYIGLPNFLRYNEPEGPNSVVKAWPAALELIPECPEKRVLATRCKSYLDSKGPQFLAKSDSAELWQAIEHAMRDAIGHAMSEPSPIQEQEQEKEKEVNPLGVQKKPRTPADDPAGFADCWSAYPNRLGGNSRKEAMVAYRARLRAGATPADLLSGVQRYAAFVRAEGKEGTAYVKQAASFLGPADHWRELWGSQPATAAGGDWRENPLFKGAI